MSNLNIKSRNMPMMNIDMNIKTQRYNDMKELPNYSKNLQRLSNKKLFPWKGKSVKFSSGYSLSGMWRDSSITAATKEIERERNKIKKMLVKNKKEKKKLKVINYIENLREANPNIYYPDSLADGTIKEIIEYDIKFYQKHKSEEAAKVIQRWFRNWRFLRAKEILKKGMILRIQRWFRRLIKKRRQKEKFLNAIVTIQSFWRGYCVRKQDSKNLFLQINENLAPLMKKKEEILDAQARYIIRTWRRKLKGYK